MLIRSVHQRRRKAKEAQEALTREKDAFKEREIATSQAAVQRYMEEMEKWKKEAEINRAASDEYKRLLESVRPSSQYDAQEKQC